jgi:hypothetical protein
LGVTEDYVTDVAFRLAVSVQRPMPEREKEEENPLWARKKLQENND